MWPGQSCDAAAGRAESPPDQRQQRLAAVRQCDAELAAVKQRAASLPLHGGDGMTHAGLGVAKRIRRQRDVPQLGNLQEYLISNL